MRFLIYIVIGAGGALAALALSFVLLGEPDVETVTPQPASETAGVTASVLMTPPHHPQPQHRQPQVMMAQPVPVVTKIRTRRNLPRQTPPRQMPPLH